MKKRVLIIVDYYLPGYKGGGPIASVSRIVDALGSDFDFYVLTRDRDLGDTAPYPCVTADIWSKVGNYHVYYCSPENLNINGFRMAIEIVQPEVVYLNSFFSKTTRIALALRKIASINTTMWVVAPRGEFYPGALSIKSLKKSVYIPFVKWIGLYRKVVWHASTEVEGSQIRTIIAERAPIIVVVDPISPPLAKQSDFEPLVKSKGEAKFCWLSRISPNKNLLFAIQSLAKCTGNATLTVYGPIENEEYWNLCLAAAKKLPKNVTFQHDGGIPPNMVSAELAKHHFFLFPTMGENFGHAIAEALAVGRPILLSDQTPWNDIVDTNAGWITPLNDLPAWRRIVQDCIDMQQAEYTQRSFAGLQFIHKKQESDDVEKNYEIFQQRAV